MTKTDQALFDWYKKEVKFGRVDELVPTLETDWEIVEVKELT